MKKPNFTKRLLALLLVLAMTVGYLPVMTNAAELTVSDKVADPQTLHNWQAYYGDSSILPDGSTGTSTWKAGGVWTDKSVFASDKDITDAGLPTSLTDPNAFLVSLSALASNKEVVGQSSAPTDTVLVLDLSNSMDQSGSVNDMIEAANETIDTLLKMNVNNRVGVVLYSGNTSSRQDAQKSSATVILPLDHYTTTTTSRENGVTKYQYLTVSGTSDTTVSVAAGTRNSNNVKPNGSKNTNGGTYIQNGLFQAWETFEDMTDKGVVQSGTQAGIQRTPILVLMSDGAPTIATTDYYSVGTSNTGDGTDTTDRITFLTQLTAAWVKGKISNYYNTTAKFYTLGLGTSSNENATAVLYPSGSNQTLRSYWTNFNAGSTDGSSVAISGQGNNRWNLTYQSVAETVGMNYVDRYWAASNSSSMIAAFKEIVDEIGLQSAYTATLVQSGDADLDGYITVEDELGSMMMVKDIKGILLGDTLFTGQELAKSMTEGNLGSTTNPTSYGDEFVATVKERLGVDTSVAQQLIAAAYADNQLYYNTETGAYANYIGWYGDADNNYLGFWDKDTGLVADGAPAGAKYINQSYGFLGGTAGAVGATDMMHIIVMVHTEITTGHQTVLFKVPAALIPMVTYKVELEGDSLESATDVKLSVEETDPIRLLYEVGLPDDVNDLNLQQKVAEYLAKDGSNHIHRNADGSFTFYANSWGADHGVAPDISELSDSEKQALTASVAESHFIPNTANERFYVLEDSLVYTKSGSTYSVLTSLPVAGGEYYFARTIVNVTGANGKAEAVTQYEILSAATVAQTSNFEIVDGNCIVKEGTIRQTLSNLELAKSENTTDTIGYSDSLWVYIPSNSAEDYNVYSFLGNNGKLTITPATGIAVTKALAEVADGASADEAFGMDVRLDWAYSADNLAALSVTDANGDPLTENTDYVLGAYDNKVLVTLYLQDGEIAYITGIPADIAYIVTEAENSKYAASYTYENPDKMTQTGIIDGVIVTNEPVKPGSLYITKEVAHAYGGEIFPTDHEFEFEVTFVDVDGQPIADTTFQLENNYDATLTELTTDENGVMEGKLRHGETVYIQGIPAGATVTVEEVNIPANYTTTAYSSIDYSGDTPDADGEVTIVSGANATVEVLNTYTPDEVSVEIGFDGTKNFDATKMTVDSEFTFKLQKNVNGTWTDVDGEVVTVTGGTNASERFVLDPLQLEFAEPGIHSYQIVEVKGDNSDITYDRSVYAFSVNVTIDSNGDLQAEVVGYNQKDNVFEVTDDAASGYTVTTVFTNQYHTTATSIEIVKSVEDKGGTGKTAAGFVIETYNASVDAEGNWTLGEFIRSAVTDAEGEALLVRNYDNTDFERNDGDGDGVVTYHFVIKEKNAGAKGWTYDATEYRITVVLTKDDAGVITADFGVVKVDAQGNATDLGVSGDTAAVTFANTFDPDDAEVALNTLVKKSLEGRELKAGEFTFAIFEDGKTQFDANGNLTNIGAAKATGTNDAAGNVTFAPEMLTFSKAGRYEFDIIEIKGSLGGVTYDPIIYDLVVEVADNGDGTLKASYYFVDSVGTTVTYKNTYTAEPTEAVIEGMKTIRVNSGVKNLTAGMFTFGLYDSTGKEIATTTNLVNGSFIFDAIEYSLDDAGETFTYTVKEIAPDGTTDGSYSANGMTYSSQSFTVTVEVTDDGKGNLEAAVTGNGTDAIKFVNEYTSKPVPVSLQGNKTLSGRDLTAGEFRFAIYASDATFTQTTLVTDQITNAADGTVSFDFGTLGMGYHYFVVEEVIPEARAAGIHYDASEYHITIQVTDSGNGQMSALTTVYHPGDPNAVNPAIAFNNTYRPEDSELVITGSKTLTGGKTLEAEDFAFELYEGDNKLDEAKVSAAGTFAFETITYTADDIGTHTYTVKEVIPAGATAENGWVDGNITYDPTVYTVVVTVADEDKDGALEISKTVDGSAETQIAFANVYTPDPVELTLEATKQYNKEFGAGKFTFTLEGEGFDKQTKTNDADGKVTFDTLQLTEAKTYTFTVKEKEEVLWGFINWDKSEYTVTVTVENQNGVLVITEQTVTVGEEAKDGGILFNNEYVLDGEGQVTLSGTKTLTGDRTAVEAGEFAFGLYDATGALVESVKNDANGNFTFTTLEFDETDVSIDGQTELVYTVKEIAGDNARYTYDDTVYTVTITIKDNNQGGIDVSHTITANGAEAELSFANTYTNPTPVTYAPEAQKHYNKDMVGGEFTFQLEGQIAGAPVEQTKTNAADGKIVFDALSFPEAGTYTFTVKEIEKVLGFINYSSAEHEIVVKVIDTKGVLSIEFVTINNDANGTIEFTNVYKFDGEGQVTLSGTKTLTGDRTAVEAGEFAFGLYDASGALVESVKNDANGNFAFTTLEFDETDVSIDGQTELVYTVKEIAGDNDAMTYDDTVYTVTILIKDNNQGGIDVSHTITDGENAAELNFTNTYTITGTGKLELTGSKELTGGKPLADGEFEFGLYADGVLIASAENVGEIFTIAKEYTKAELGAHTYTVQEILPDGAVENDDGTWTLGNITYDPAVYTVNVTVSDNGEGGIAVAYELMGAEAIVFQNIYTPDDKVVTIGVEKLLDNKTDKTVSLKGFEFEIACGKDVHTATSNEKGHAGFEVTFSAEHIGQTYEFKVSEKNTGIKGMTYDKTVYTIKVQVQQNEDGTIKTVINDQTADKATVKFTNVYEELVTPPTGDNFNLILPIVLMVLSILGVVAVISFRKKKVA